MPTIWDGTTRFKIEEGQSYAGWTLVKVECQGAYFAIGTHAFTFERGNEVCRITNEKWPGERAWCTDGKLRVFECPAELVLFAWRTTRVIDETTEAAERHEQEG